MTDELKLFLILLSVGGLGGSIFGYTTGVIAGALPAMEEEFPSLANSSIEQGIFTAAILLGALIGAAYASGIATILNKRRTLFVCGLIVAIGSILCAVLPRLGLILLSREILGVGVGVISVICPVYVSELAPKRFSGALGSWFQVALTFGILVSYLSNLIFANVIFNFRWMFGIGCIPGILLCALYFVMPMAPSDIKTAPKSVQKYTNKDKATGVKMYVEIFKTQKWGILLSIVLASTLQFTGINAVLYYAPTIFANAGFSGDTASLLASLGVGVWNFLSTFVAIFLVDRVGRRPLLLGGLAVMMVSVVILGFVFQFLINVNQTLSGILSIVFLFTYIIGFEAGIGSLFWPLLTETFDEEYKSAGASMGNVLQWSFNIILSTTFPFLISFFSQGIVFWGFGAVSFLCFIFLFFKLPETKQATSTTVEDFTIDVQSSGGDIDIFSD